MLSYHGQGKEATALTYSEIVIDGQVMAYCGHPAANRWEHRGRVFMQQVVGYSEETSRLLSPAGGKYLAFKKKVMLVSIGKGIGYFAG